MTRTNPIYHHYDGRFSTDLAKQLVNVMGFQDAILMCIENQWSGTENAIRHMRKDIVIR